MSGTNYCPKCGHSNRSDAKFCGQCATPLAQPADIGPYRSSRTGTPTATSDEEPWWQSSSSVNLDSTAIDRTGNGLFLVIISLILGPIPYVMYVGWIIGLVGVVMIIIGRKPFGQLHSNLVNLSVGIWLVGFILSFIVIASYSIDVTSATYSGIDQNSAQQALITAFNNLEIGALISTAVIGISHILLTFSLQKANGRIVLSVAYFTSILMGIVVASIVIPQVDTAVAQSIATQNLTPLNDLRTESELLGLLGLIPATMWGFAYYLAYQRIANGEIPNRRTLPAQS